MTRILAVLLIVLASPATAHLMPANNGTVSVHARNTYTVLSVPVSALKGFDDNADGQIDTAELGRHDASLKAQIEARVRVTADGAAPVEALTMIAAAHKDDHTEGPSDYVVVMLAQRFTETPRVVEVWTDLFGKTKQEQSLTLTATHNGGEEIAVLSPKRSKHRFFRRLAAAK